MRIASIDLGTNTFNLLIADAGVNFFNVVHRDKRGVKLGRGGINQHIIRDDAWQRGIEALTDYSKDIRSFKPDRIVATATSAIRNATNGNEFVSAVREKFGIDIRIIDGKEEARLIFDGVKHAVPIETEPVLVMDIGGGSIEFIIADCSGIKWHNSFELGASRLLEKFSPSDPITNGEQNSIEDYVRKELKELFISTSSYPVKTLIGSSGSFDALANITSFIQKNEGVPIDSKYFKIPVNIYEQIHNKLLISDLCQRKQIPGMDLIRVELIVIGSILINIVINKLSISQIIQSSYAIKEGVIFNSLGI